MRLYLLYVVRMYVLLSPRSCFHCVTLASGRLQRCVQDRKCMYALYCMYEFKYVCVCMEEGVTSEDYIALYDDMTFLGMFFFKYFVYPLVSLFL